jgi:hypothetical protein
MSSDMYLYYPRNLRALPSNLSLLFEAWHASSPSSIVCCSFSCTKMSVGSVYNIPGLWIWIWLRFSSPTTPVAPVIALSYWGTTLST